MTINNITNNQVAYERLSSGTRINRASDDPAGLGISESLKALTKGIETGTDNAYAMRGALNTADGALSSINDNLQRIRELSVQASNGIYSADDKESIQKEVQQLKDSISDATKYTEFNGFKLLDGSFADRNLASNPYGSGMKINIENTGLETLGIKDFDVTKDFNLDSIDNAINMVSQQQSKLGADDNRIGYTIDYNQISAENQTSAFSRISDADIAKEASDKRTTDILNTYKFHMQKQMQINASNMVNLLA